MISDLKTERAPEASRSPMRPVPCTSRRELSGRIRTGASGRRFAVRRADSWSYPASATSKRRPN